MAKSVNKAIIVGNLTRDIELKYTPNNTPVTSFSIATNDSWTNNNGEKMESVEYHNCVAWNKLAEICNQILKKGSKVYIEGKLQTRSWEKDGNKFYKTEINVRDLVLLNSPRDAQSGDSGQQTPQDEDMPEAPENLGDLADDIPF